MPKSPDQLVRPEILAIKAYHVAEAAGMVKLDAMENPYRLPPEMRAELASVLAEAEPTCSASSAARVLAAD